MHWTVLLMAIISNSCWLNVSMTITEIKILLKSQISWFRIFQFLLTTRQQNNNLSLHVSLPVMTSTSSFKESVLDILCGSIAGGTAKIIEYPFDTVKVRLQSQPDHHPPKFKGPLDCFQQTIRREGFRGLFRGISSPIVGAAAENASLFVSYQWAQQFMKTGFYPNLPNDRLPFGALLVCGGISGIVTSFILTPIELVKCQMQVQSLYQAHTADTLINHPTNGPRISAKNIHTLNLPGPLKLITSIYQREGITGFWRGQTGTLFREAGGSAAWFGCYEYVTEWFRRHYRKDTNTTGEAMLAGAVSGVAFNLSLFPADTIKSRIQTQAMTNDASSRIGFFQMGKKIYHSGGIKALYRGCGITIGRAAPSSAVIFATYETLKDFTKKYI